MRPVKHQYTAVVLAGERPGGSAISQELDLSANVLVTVAGKSALARVIETLETSEMVEGGLLCGPVEEIYRDNEEFRQIIRASSFQWTAPESGPSASALAALEQLDRYPVLLTTGDHALLSPGVVDFFCREGLKMDVDVVCGLVPYAIVRAAYPESKRTVLKFSDGQYCGTNLFAILNRAGKAGPDFWRELEAQRKRPWRMVRRLGTGLLLRYLFGRLSLDRALVSLSRAVGCRIGYVRIDVALAAVDVDSVADRDLAEKILLQ